jgi:hypothetical protein
VAEADFPPHHRCFGGGTGIPRAAATRGNDKEGIPLAVGTAKDPDARIEHKIPLGPYIGRASQTRPPLRLRRKAAPLRMTGGVSNRVVRDPSGGGGGRRHFEAAGCDRLG